MEPITDSSSLQDAIQAGFVADIKQSLDDLNEGPGGIVGTGIVGTGFVLPEATQQEEDSDNDLDEDEDNAVTALQESYESLLAKSFRMKALAEEQIEMDRQADNPYEILGGAAAEVETMEGEEKTNAVEQMKAIIELFNAAKVDEGTRNFLAALFAATKTYKDQQAKRAANDLEYKRLSKLYYEQKKKDLNDKLEAQFKKHMEGTKKKAAEKVDKKAEKAEAQAAKKRETKGETSAAKKAKGETSAAKK